MDANSQPRISKFKLLKNLGLICVSFFLLFTGYDGLSFLQSTMNVEEGIGMIGQAIIYFTFCTSALIFSKYFIRKMGCKYSIIIAQISYVPYIASNFYPHWFTVVPSALLLGPAAAVLWGAQSVYINKASTIYCSLTDENEEMNQENTNLKLDDGSESPDDPSRNQNDYVSSLVDGELKTTTSNVLLSRNENCQTEEDVFLELSENCDTKKDAPDNMRLERQRTVRQDVTNAVFFGTHLCFVKCALICSNLMSYYILKMGMTGTVGPGSCHCGANFCSSDTECIKNNLYVSVEDRYLLSGLCVGFMVLGIILLIALLEPIEDTTESVTFSFKILFSTMKQHKEKEQIFMIPLSFLIGQLQGFYLGDVTMAYIGCAMGTYFVGLVTLSFGIASAIGSSLSGLFVKFIGRIPVVLLGIASSIGTCVLLLTWTPSDSQLHVFVVIASLFGVSSAVLWSQTAAFYGVLFRKNEESAYSAFFTWDSLGWAFSLILTNYLCIYIKIYILIFVSFLALLGYLITERIFALKNQLNIS